MTGRLGAPQGPPDGRWLSGYSGQSPWSHNHPAWTGLEQPRDGHHARRNGMSGYTVFTDFVSVINFVLPSLNGSARGNKGWMVKNEVVAQKVEDDDTDELRGGLSCSKPKTQGALSNVKHRYVILARHRWRTSHRHCQPAPCGTLM